MKQNIPQQTPLSTPANDNALIRVEITCRAEPVSHVYVPETLKAGARKARRLVRITTNLPKNLPILPEEMALVQANLADLVSSILANDNEPD